MTKARPELRAAAERLLDFEAGAGKRAGALQPAAARVTARFGLVLTTLLGVGGYRALLARALTLARAEAPDLSAVQVGPAGALEGLSAAEAPGGTRFADGEVVLVAHLLGLLLTFVGEALMLRVVQDAWPKVRLDDLDFEQGTNP